MSQRVYRIPTFVVTVVILAIAYVGVSGSAFADAKGAGDRPNILLAISDDQSWAHTGMAGDPVVKTPTFDRVARQGVYFPRAFCSSPSCTPSRGSILTGRHFWQLETGADLWSHLPAKFPVYPNLLEAAGYHVGFTRKGWGPGDLKAGGYKRNPAGKRYKNFEQFFKSIPDGKPFCFWFGSFDPHRPYKKGSGVASGKRIEDVRVPPSLPDTPEIRSDLLDYYVEVERFDREVGQILEQIKATGMLDNTLVIVTSDNGMPFPRAKTNLYDDGTRMPLAIHWPAKIKPGRTIDDFVVLPDLAPTILEAAGLTPPETMTAKSLLTTLQSDKSGRVDPTRDRAVFGRERHTIYNEGGLGYPCRAIRTDDFLFIRNFEPDRWPAGNPDVYGDIDGSPTKFFMMDHRDDPRTKRLFELAFVQRPAEELYDLRKDPGQLANVATQPEYADVRKRLRDDLDQFLKETGDPRAVGKDGGWDTQPYYGKRKPSSHVHPKHRPKSK